MNCSITAENAAKPAHPTRAAFGPPNKVKSMAFQCFKIQLPLADKTPPVKHPADKVLVRSCFARY